MKRRSFGVLALILGVVLTSAYVNTSFAEDTLSGHIKVSEIDIERTVIIDFEITISSNNSFNSILFLPAALGSSLIENSTNEIGTQQEVQYKLEKLECKVVPYCWRFPCDSYELGFIFGFDEEITLNEKTLRVSFVDLSDYYFWHHSPSEIIETKSEQILQQYSEYVTVSASAMERKIEDKDLISFYLIKVIISRPI